MVPVVAGSAVADLASAVEETEAAVLAGLFAASFAALGATAAQAFACVFLANAIVLVPMVASAQIGTKYGAPFPVIARAAFGTKGSRVPVFLRALVGCGWFGIQSHVGGQAIFAIACAAAALRYSHARPGLPPLPPPLELADSPSMPTGRRPERPSSFRSATTAPGVVQPTARGRPGGTTPYCRANAADEASAG